ncbi:transposase [Azospirillum sp. SYSU D00513]|uniref:IS66 family transposase n=1 Tax=Azospirillum sp. SYSU D00513 TaxID=2812561 RepID=UPI001A9727CE|nr:transposase [Azospirillum sp. SYSU D00513]
MPSAERPSLSGLSRGDLEALLERLLAENAALKQMVAELRAEVAQLKGVKGKPEIKPAGKPSGMEAATGASAEGRPRRRRGRAGKVSKRVACEDRVLSAAVPEGSRFKGYEDFTVQELELRARRIRFRRERWATPDGRCVLAPLPAGIAGHLGPELQRFVLFQYHRGQTTIPRLAALLGDLGLDVSKRQIVRLLTRNSTMLEEAGAVLRAGLETASWLTVDDTGARHKGANGVCTQLGDDRFTAFVTTGSKSRLNFLELLRAGHEDYVINAAALEYMRKRGVPLGAVARLEAQSTRRFADEATWLDHLRRLDWPTRAHQLDPVRLATEGALWGSINAHGLLPDTVIVSDDAGQFDVGLHALCWVHAERLVHKLDTFTPAQHTAQQHVRSLIWWFYADLKTYQRAPTPRRRAQLRARFERIFQRRTGFSTLDRLLARLRANGKELLRVLDRPDIPLHTNGSENDLRGHVTRRKVSGGTRSDQGRDARDGFLGLMKTCAKLGIAFWDFLGHHLGVPDSEHVSYLPDIIRQRAAQP